MSSTAVLVADLVESTALSTRLGDDAFERVLQEHDEVVADVVTSSHGRLVKFLGDGFIAAFAAASDALDCAEAFQQMTSRLSEVAGEPVRARVGVSLGDVFEREGDLHGRPMVEAARLCAAAPNGTILCTEVTHRSASGRPDGAFGPVQHLDLKGLPTLEARELHWKPAAEPRARRPGRRDARRAPRVAQRRSTRVGWSEGTPCPGGPHRVGEPDGQHRRDRRRGVGREPAAHGRA